MLVQAGKFIKAMGGAFFAQMVVHHALSILFWPYAFHVDLCVGVVAYYMATEVTNTLLNPRWIIVERGGKSGTLFMAINAAFFLAFVAVRIVPIPVLMQVFLAADWGKLSTLDLALTSLNVIPLALNVFWFKLLIQGAHKTLFAAKKRP